MSLTTCLYNDNKISIKDFDSLPEKNKRNFIKCMCCNTKLIAKLGKIKIHHFAHENKIECDTFRTTDSMTFWHQYWQSFVNTEYFEYIIIKNNKKHIADIYNPDKKLVIEIQHSNISQEKIKEREDFYDNMIWLIDETTKCCNDCENNYCSECEYYIKICDKCKNKNCCYNKINGLFCGDTFMIIKNINNPFFLSAEKSVFLHVENYILKFITKLDNNYIFCEIIKMEKFISDFFPISPKYDIKNIVESINNLYSQEKNICKRDGDFEYNIDNEKIIISCQRDDINSLIECGFQYYKKRSEYIYFFDRNQSYCNKCNLILTIGTELCNDCYSITKYAFTNNWYNIFDNNEIVSKKLVSTKYSEIELNIKEPIIIKTKNNNEIKITKTIIFMDEYNTKNYDENNFYIYFADNKTINYKNEDEYNIEKIIIYNKTFYRIKKEFPKGCLLDVNGKNLYLTLYFSNNNYYTYLEPIKRKTEFLKELSNITIQKLKWNINPLEILYDYTNYDELLNKEDNRIKFIFYCINFVLYEDDINYYNIIALLGYYTKNELVLDLYLKWLVKFRINNEDFKIDFGKHKNQFYYNLKYEYLLWLEKNDFIIFNKNMRITLNTHLLQHPDKCKKIFYNNEIMYKDYMHYFYKIFQEYNNEFIGKIRIEDKIIIK
jgi:competence CoiA-like predicted nuclease